MPSLRDIIAQTPFLSTYPETSYFILWMLLVGVLSFVVHFISRLILIRATNIITARSKNTIDDTFAKHHVFGRLAHIAPALVILALAPGASAASAWIEIVEIAAYIYITMSVVLFFHALLSAIKDIYDKTAYAKKLSITSFIQVGKLIITLIGLIVILSILLNKSPATLLAGFGAMTAVTMLVFRDPIMGFVAGIQLSSNRMVNRGDWIEMPKYGVDGDVMEIGLTTVKIRNFDKTVTTVPTQTLITDSFKNWRGIQEAGGRRIKRSVMIDMQTIKFCDEEMIKRLSNIQIIRGYLTEKTEELAKYNQEMQIDPAALANGRRLTNIGVFRAYIVAYLKQHPSVHQNLTLLVRQLKPTENGAPMELYCFTNDIRWAQYEGIQADIFDHIFAAAHEFDLRLFQNPTGFDWQRVA